MNNEKEQFDDTINKLELMRHMSLVHSNNIKGDVSPDFTFSRLSDKDKEYITEMFANAKYCKSLLMRRAETEKKWVWGDNCWKLKDINHIEKNKINKIASSVFDAFMNRIYMIAILNRNVKNNYLVRLLSGLPEEEAESGEDEEEGGIMEKLKGVFKNEERR